MSGTLLLILNCDKYILWVELIVLNNDYLLWINQSQPKEEIENIRHALKRSKPYGSGNWTTKIILQFGLETTVRNPWRPKKST